MTSDRGSALIETVLVGVVLIVPLMWMLGVLADLHRTALAATAAAREAGFDAARATTLANAERAVDDAVDRAFTDQGLDAGNAKVSWTSEGLERGSRVELRVTYPVTVLQAPLVGRVAGPSIIVNAEHVAYVDPYRSRP